MDWVKSLIECIKPRSESLFTVMLRIGSKLYLQYERLVMAACKRPKTKGQFLGQAGFNRFVLFFCDFIVLLIDLYKKGAADPSKVAQRGEVLTWQITCHDSYLCLFTTSLFICLVCAFREKSLVESYI